MMKWIVPWIFVAATASLTWVSAWVLESWWPRESRQIVTRGMGFAVFYVVLTLWPQLAGLWLARRSSPTERQLDLGLRPASRPYIAVAAVAPAGLILSAALFGWSMSAQSMPFAQALGEAAEPGLAGRSASLLLAAAMFAALAGTMVSLVVQAAAEELVWRGYLLGRLADCFGVGAGMACTGALWGAWYAALVCVLRPDTTRAEAFGWLVTFQLLGGFLALLRLASRSIVPGAVVNAALSWGAGLPYLLQGVEPGLRGAFYGPAGWIPLVFGMALLAAVLPGVLALLGDGSDPDAN